MTSDRVRQSGFSTIYPVKQNLGQLTLGYAGYPWPRLGAVLHLASHLSTAPLLVTALPAVILALTRLIKALGPHVVRVYRARLARAVVQDVGQGKMSAAEGASMISALAQLEAAARGRERAPADPGAGSPGRGADAAPLRRVKRAAPIRDVSGTAE